MNDTRFSGSALARINLGTALKCAALGIGVIPCWETSGHNGKEAKKPYGDCAPDGFASATTDTNTIRKWWKRHPGALPALYPADLFGVIDVDVRGGKLGAETFAEIDAAGLVSADRYRVETPSGGFHVYVPSTGEKILTDPYDPARSRGIDYRGTGGYVIAPGAVLPDGRFWDGELTAEIIAELTAGEPVPFIKKYKAGWLGKTGNAGRARRADNGSLGGTLGLILQALQARSWLGLHEDPGEPGHYRARCPVHGAADRPDGGEHSNTSLAVGPGDNAEYVLHCYAGCDAVSVLGALGLPEIAERHYIHAQADYDSAATNVTGVTLTRASDIVEKSVEHLWQHHLFRGKLHEIIGDSETGKSLITEADWPARVTTGRPFPGEPRTATREPENVIITATEDDFRDTIVPRLAAADADLSRVFKFELEEDEHGNPVPLTLPDRTEDLRSAIEQVKREYGPVGYLVISPISAYLAEDIRSGVDASVRRALSPLVRVADDHGVATVFVRHPNKDRSMKAVDRGSGSGAFTALVRASYGVGRKSATAEHSLADVKSAASAAGSGEEFVFTRNVNNYAPRGRTPSRCYRIVPSAERPDHPVIEWGAETTLTADDVLSKPDARKRAPRRAAAKVAICELLNVGPTPRETVFERVMGKTGVSPKTVYAAADELGVEKVQVRTEDNKTVEQWIWQWPDGIKVQMLSE